MKVYWDIFFFISLQNQTPSIFSHIGIDTFAFQGRISHVFGDRYAALITQKGNKASETNVRDADEAFQFWQVLALHHPCARSLLK